MAGGGTVVQRPFYPLEGKRAGVRALLVCRAAVAENERVTHELVALWRRHVFKHGLMLSVVRPASEAAGKARPGAYFPAPHIVWRDVPDGSATPSGPLAFDGPEMNGLAERLDDETLAVLLGFEWRRLLLVARQRYLCGELTAWEHWFERLQALEAAVPLPVRRSDSGPLIDPVTVSAGLSQLGDPRSSPFRGKRPFLRAYHESVDELEAICASQKRLVAFWTSLAVPVAASLSFHRGKVLRWRLSKKEGGSRVAFFDDAIQALFAALEPAAQCAMLAAEYRRSLLEAKRAAMTARVRAHESVRTEVNALEDMAPPALRSTLVRPRAPTGPYLPSRPPPLGKRYWRR